MQRANILRLHFSEAQRWEGKPLHEEIVRACREMGIAGATVFRGLEGYGDTAEIHRSHVMLHDQPIVVVIVDEEERISALLPVVERMMHRGVIAMSAVEAVRVQRR